MLIPSPRHTADDLRLWSDLEAADLRHYCAARVDAKANDAAQAIRDFATHAVCYCSVSWGKDSVVLAHLACIASPHAPLVWIRVQPIASPECVAVRDAYLATPCQPYHEIEIWCRRDGREWRASGTLESGFRQAAALIGTSRRLCGVRAAESSSRRLSAAFHGISTRHSCRPLLHWSTADVYAYLAHHQLPIHPAYAMLGGGRWDRERVRVASLGGRRGDGCGRAEWEQEYYPDVLRRLQTRH